MEDKGMVIVGVTIVILLIIAAIFFEGTPVGRKIWDEYVESREQTTEPQSYSTLYPKEQDNETYYNFCDRYVANW